MTAPTGPRPGRESLELKLLGRDFFFHCEQSFRIAVKKNLEPLEYLTTATTHRDYTVETPAYCAVSNLAL